VQAADGVTVALELGIDDELDLERRVYELIRRVNTMRKEAGLDLTDRIDLVVPAADAELLEHADWIKSETLAVSLDASGSELTLVRAG
jgi:isoleucyl-tRNA synthetase